MKGRGIDRRSIGERKVIPPALPPEPLRSTALPSARATAMVSGISAAVALLVPSSVGGSISVVLPSAACALLAGLALVVAALNAASYMAGALSFAILAILFLATAVSPLAHFTPGAFFPYLLLCAVLAVRIQPRSAAHSTVTYFRVLSCVVQAFAWLSFVEAPGVLTIGHSLYQAFYDDLFEQMIEWHGKPVGFFASHSIAALFYFGFLATHVRLRGVSRGAGRAVDGLSLLSYVGLLALLKSTTAFFALAILACWLLSVAWRRALPALVVVGIAASLFLGQSAVPSFDAAMEPVVEAVLSPDNGLLGRYASGTRLQPTYDFIRDHPLTPIGITSDPVLVSIGDNFIAEYVLRGSLPLYLAILVASFSFWRRNLGSARDGWFFFLFFLACDIGYPLLTYFRAMGSALLVVQVWNYCHSAAHSVSQTPSPTNGDRRAARVAPGQPSRVH